MKKLRKDLNFDEMVKFYVFNYTYDEYTTEDDIKNEIKKDYDNMIELRNRLKEPNTKIYEEDHILCDNILNYMEVFMELIGIEKE